MNQSIREEIEEILIRHKELGYLKNQTDAVDQILRLLHSTLKKRIQGGKYRETKYGWKTKGEGGYATNYDFCEGVNNGLSKAQQIIDEVMK